MAQTAEIGREGGATPEIEFWFEFASTYSYLSVMRIDDMAASRGIKVVWRPFLLGPIFAAQGMSTSPFNLYPQKGAYMWRDMARLCAERGLAFHRPDPFPQNGLLAARVALAALDHSGGRDFVKAIYTAQFGGGAQISDPEVVQAALTSAGLSADLMAAAQDPDIKATLKAQTDRAQAMGLFGAPSFTVGGDLFWGDDRLEAALAMAERQEASV